MNSKYEAALADYAKFTFADGPWTRSVYRRGSGPAVIVIHEIPGLHPLVIRFADRIVAAGMTVFLPVLFGEPGRPVTSGYALRSMLSAICIHREFNVWSAGGRARLSNGCVRSPEWRMPNAAAAASAPSACASPAASLSP